MVVNICIEDDAFSSSSVPAGTDTVPLLIWIDRKYKHEAMFRVLLLLTVREI